MIYYLRGQRLLDLFCRFAADGTISVPSPKTGSSRSEPTRLSALRRNHTLPVSAACAIALAVVLSSGTSVFAEQNDSVAQVGSDAALDGNADAVSQSGDDQLPTVEVKSAEPDTVELDAAPKKAEVQQTEYKPVTKKKRKKKKATQVSSPSPASSAAVVADSYDNEDEITSGPAAGGEAIRGSLGTGTTDVDGYVAGASSTFTKTNTRLQDIPQSISVITEQQLKDQGHESLGEALQYVPGVTVQQGEGHRDQITIRGQETNADFFTDGVRDDIQYFRDLYNIEAVEVLKGPAALVFGRGGGGGIVNRVTKKAEWRDIKEASINFGMYDRKRVTIDVGGAATNSFAFRLNAMYEDSENFRDFFELERYGFNPTVAFRLTPKTLLRASYQYHYDNRTVDRGVPSLNGRPLEGFQDTFFGSPNANFSKFESHVATATLEHEFDSGLQFRQHVSYNHYDKFYQNIFAASSVDAAGNFEIGEIGGGDDGGYNSGTDRESFFSQTDFSYKFNSGDLMRHTVAFGADFSWQDQRNTRFIPTFAGGVGGLIINVSNPASFVPVSFDIQTRDRNVDLKTQGFYIQDQVEITKYFEVIAGIRYDRFDLDFFNALNGDRVGRVDAVWSPRIGAVVKPTSNLSIYASWSKSFLPSAGDQFDNLGGGRDDFEPQEFENREIGFKWALMPRLHLTGALFQLDRTNQPVTVAGIDVTSGETETRGGEVGLTGYVTDDWQINLGYANIRSEITDNGDNGNGLLGNSVESVPRHQFSIWNRYQFSKMFGAGLGLVHQSEFFAASSNTVTVPSFTRVDAAVYLDFNENWSAQVNVENLFDTDYFASAHNNNNISPGAPLSAYATIRAKF